VSKYLNPRGLRILSALDQVAANTASTPAQVAVAWVMAQPGVTSPIASATSLEQLRELTAAAQLVLPPQALALLDKASSPE
jgi:aryl-alcohol dehydrogenase-like predicted oxidoreductase